MTVLKSVMRWINDWYLGYLEYRVEAAIADYRRAERRTRLASKQATIENERLIGFKIKLIRKARNDQY